MGVQLGSVSPSEDVTAFWRGVVYIPADIIGYFHDSVDAGYPPDMEIDGFEYVWPGPRLVAFMRHKVTGVVSPYVWDFGSNKPQPFDNDAQPPVMPKPVGPASPPSAPPTEGMGIAERKSNKRRQKPGSSMDRSAKAWSRRYD